VQFKLHNNRRILYYKLNGIFDYNTAVHYWCNVISLSPECSISE